MSSGAPSAAWGADLVKLRKTADNHDPPAKWRLTNVEKASQALSQAVQVGRKGIQPRWTQGGRFGAARARGAVQDGAWIAVGGDHSADSSPDRREIDSLPT